MVLVLMFAGSRVFHTLGECAVSDMERIKLLREDTLYICYRDGDYSLPWVWCIAAFHVCVKWNVIDCFTGTSWEEWQYEDVRGSSSVLKCAYHSMVPRETHATF